MRLVIGVLTFCALLIYVQWSHPECSMADMVGVDWLACVTNLKLGETP
jgi:hypothetical protein